MVSQQISIVPVDFQFKAELSWAAFLPFVCKNDVSWKSYFCMAIVQKWYMCTRYARGTIPSTIYARNPVLLVNVTRRANVKFFHEPTGQKQLVLGWLHNTTKMWVITYRSTKQEQYFKTYTRTRWSVNDPKLNYFVI